MQKKKTNSESAQRGKRNKNKGNRFELEVIHKFRDAGYTDCVSSRSQDKSADANKIDIVSEELPILVQCKYTQNTPNYFGISNECTDKSKPFGIVWKKAETGHKSPGTIIMLPFDYYLSLINKPSEGR